MDRELTPCEGDLYKIMTVGRYTFEMRYGYYLESDRANSDPAVLFPNLEAEPVYTKQGQPLVTAVQEPCAHYVPRKPHEKEDWCADCIHYPHVYEEIAVCGCEARRIVPPGTAYVTDKQ